jgi:hypothetical protein
MEDTAAAVIGILILLGFAGGLAWQIGALPLTIITCLVLLMAILDVALTLRDRA